MLCLICQTHTHVQLDRFTKTFFWNFQSIRADLCYILIYKQMLEKAFCSNIAPSLSSGNHLFYKAEYMGQSCPNQVWAITFDWGALATWNKHFWTAFWRLFSGIPHLPGLGDVPGALCQVTWKVGKWGIPEMGYQNAVQKCLFLVASAHQSKVMAQTWLGQLRPMYSAL